MTKTKHDPYNSECRLIKDFSQIELGRASEDLVEEYCSCPIETPAPEVVSAPTVEEGETMKGRFEKEIMEDREAISLHAMGEQIISFIESEITLARADERKKVLGEEIEKLPMKLGDFQDKNYSAGYNTCIKIIKSRLEAELKALNEAL